MNDKYKLKEDLRCVIAPDFTKRHAIGYLTNKIYFCTLL